MPTERRRITFEPDTDALAVLGYSLDDEGNRGGITAAANGAFRVAARLVGQANRELYGVLSRAEWNAIADVMNGCADLYDYGGIDVPALLMVRANLEDSPGLGEKWGVDVADLCRRLAALTPAHGEAILAAVRHFWSNCETVDHTKDEWWKLGYRTGEPSELRPKKRGK